jgi:hypothetical protein
MFILLAVAKHSAAMSAIGRDIGTNINITSIKETKTT